VQRTCITSGVRCFHRKVHFWGVLPIERHCKHRILGSLVTGLCKNSWTNLNDLIKIGPTVFAQPCYQTTQNPMFTMPFVCCVVYLCMQLPFRGRDACASIKFFVALIFFYS